MTWRFFTSGALSLRSVLIARRASSAEAVQSRNNPQFKTLHGASPAALLLPANPSHRGDLLFPWMLTLLWSGFLRLQAKLQLFCTPVHLLPQLVVWLLYNMEQSVHEETNHAKISSSCYTHTKICIKAGLPKISGSGDYFIGFHTFSLFPTFSVGKLKALDKCFVATPCLCLMDLTPGCHSDDSFLQSWPGPFTRKKLSIQLTDVRNKHEQNKTTIKTTQKPAWNQRVSNRQNKKLSLDASAPLWLLSQNRMKTRELKAMKMEGAKPYHIKPAKVTEQRKGENQGCTQGLKQLLTVLYT